MTAALITGILLQFPVLLPQANPEGKLLDMETAVFGRKAYPASKAYHWKDDGCP